METQSESKLEYFRRNGQFSDLMILAWSEMEFNINQLVARQFELFYTDEKFRKLLKGRFYKFQNRIEFLKEKGVITQEEFSRIEELKKYRNSLFHGEDWAFFIKDENEKNKIMDEAISVANLTLDMLVR